MLRDTGRIVAALAACLLGLQACADQTPTALPASAGSAQQSPADAPVQEEIQLVARGVALALRQPLLRHQLLQDLRDSPFPEHRIHLRSYLAGERGRAITAVAAAAAGVSTDSFLAIVEGLPQLQISVPVSYDRVTWTGSDSAVVIGLTLPGKEVLRLRSITGYGTRMGEPVSVPIGVALPYPVVLIAPIEIDFGPDPEGKRRSAPKRSRKTISTSEETFFTTTDCNDETAVMECDTSGGSDAGWDSGVKLPSGYTYQCFVSVGAPGDSDGDGILQQCEAELADAFGPYLQWDQGEEGSQRQSYFAVKRGGTSTEVKIMYMMGYFADAGSDTWGTAHDGDSEFLIFTVSYKNGWWRLSTVYLSAHWRVAFLDASSLRSTEEFEHPDGNLYGRPKIWIAEDKHANYSSQQKCDEGANFQDNCDQPINALEIHSAIADRNVGNRESGTTQLLNCVVRTAHGGGGTKDECLWTDSEFSGWQNVYEKNSTGYTEILDAFDF